jgi:hypothetical protein
MRLCLFCAGIALITACNREQTASIHTELGSMTVRLRDIHLPTGDSLEIEQVAQDEFIRLNNYNGTPSVRNTEAGKTEWPLSETLAESGGAIFIVQGSKQTDTSLDRWEQINKRKIDPRVREQFKQKGGSLALEGRCNIIGELISGTEVLNRIAALPTDNTGHPLRRVRYSVSSK